MKKTNYAMLFGLAAAVALLMNQNASAASFTLNFDTEFSGGQAPGGPAPWLSATFTDTTPGTVSLTLSASPAPGYGLTGTENVDGLYLNVAPAFVGALSFSPGAPATLLSGGSLTSITQGEDAFKADGDGLYDILFSFGTGAGAGFGPGDALTETITSSVTGLTASSFDLLSTPAGGHGPFFAAAHVQNTTGAGSGGSGWIAPSGGTSVPDGASTAMLLGIALMAIGGLRRFRIA
jgi:VPDSG-CTERM motif